MKKLKLRIDKINVTSFATGKPANKSGTVKGNLEETKFQCVTDLTCPDETCFYCTRPTRCDQYTCDYIC